MQNFTKYGHKINNIHLFIILREKDRKHNKYNVIPLDMLPTLYINSKCTAVKQETAAVSEISESFTAKKKKTMATDLENVLLFKF
jgi:hypothetical protein